MLRGIYVKDINLNFFERNPVYPRFTFMFFKFLFMHKTFFAWVYFLMIYLNWQNFAREKWQHEVAKILHGFIFILFCNLVFICKGSQPRIYADLLRFQSGVKDPIHTIILMKSIIPFFTRSFHVLFLFTNKKNQGIMCNISDKNNELFLFRSI